MQSCWIAGFSIKKVSYDVGAVACAEVQLFRSYISASVEAGLSSALQCALGEKIGVASVILQPTKTVISLAAMSSLQGTMQSQIQDFPKEGAPFVWSAKSTRFSGGGVVEFFRRLREP